MGVISRWILRDKKYKKFKKAFKKKSRKVFIIKIYIKIRETINIY